MKNMKHINSDFLDLRRNSFDIAYIGMGRDFIESNIYFSEPLGTSCNYEIKIFLVHVVKRSTMRSILFIINLLNGNCTLHFSSQ